MIKVEEIREGLWTFPIVLPNNPLKWLNCYVIKPKNGRNLVIDSGFKHPDCLKELLEGLQVLGIEPNNTDVFFTHLHCDHTGNAYDLQKMGFHLLMGREDCVLLNSDNTERWECLKNRVVREGLSIEMYDSICQNNPALLYSSELFHAELLDEGDKLCYGMYVFKCVLTPGHTPGHMCLYDENNKIMILGDQVLFDITPNICNWTVVDDSLGDYIDSLNKIRNYDVKLPLPAHRSTGTKSFTQRVDELIVHHDIRIKEAMEIIKQHGPINAYNIAGKMRWQISSRNWESFPPGQKWFAFCETLAHLDYLVKRGLVSRIYDSEGKIEYIC